jgi:hypothetical protein
MPNEANSRHTAKIPRWAETAAQVPDSSIVEPASGKKDTGWVIGVDDPNLGWWNWLHWAAGVGLRYIENTFTLQWIRNHVMAGAASTEGVVTAGVGLSVNVTSARVWLDGQMHKVPAATNLALAEADPTEARIDLVCARVGLLPSYHVVTGTPAVVPDIPSTPAGSAPMYAVNVLAGATTPGTRTDLREFGALDIDLLRAGKKLSAGDLGSGENMFTVDGTPDTVAIGNDTDPIMLVEDFGEVLKVKAESVRFFTPITRKYDLGPGDFTYGDADSGIVLPFADSPGDMSASNFYLHTLLGLIGRTVAAVRIPNGCTITGFRAYGTKPGNIGEEATIMLKAVRKTTGAETVLGTADTTALGDGNFDIGVSGLSHLVTHDFVYYYCLEIRVAPVPDSSAFFWAGEVEYTEVKPFDGL